MTQQLANAAHDTEGWVEERHGSARSMGRASQHTVFARVTAYRCGATATSFSAGTDRHWTGFAPSPF